MQFTLINREEIMENLIKNGDFSQDGAYWEDKYVIYQDGKALISDKGYVQQVIELNSPFEKAV